MRNDISVMPVEIRHLAPLETLPFHHRDPFDRLLISQSLVENIPILSADSAFDAYQGVTRLW
jgi:PIN domain nuclease of toxin-antitoxin system